MDVPLCPSVATEKNVRFDRNWNHEISFCFFLHWPLLQVVRTIRLLNSNYLWSLICKYLKKLIPPINGDWGKFFKKSNFYSFVKRKRSRWKRERVRINNQDSEAPLFLHIQALPAGLNTAFKRKCQHLSNTCHRTSTLFTELSFY